MTTSTDLQALLRVSYAAWGVRPFDVYQRKTEGGTTEYTVSPIGVMPDGKGWRSYGRTHRKRDGCEHWGPANPVPVMFPSKAGVAS